MNEEAGRISLDSVFEQIAKIAKERDIDPNDISKIFNVGFIAAQIMMPERVHGSDSDSSPDHRA